MLSAFPAKGGTIGNVCLQFLGRQGGRVVRVLDFESVSPGFESHSEHFMDLFHGSPKL